MSDIMKNFDAEQKEEDRLEEFEQQFGKLENVDLSTDLIQEFKKTIQLTIMQQPELYRMSEFLTEGECREKICKVQTYVSLILDTITETTDLIKERKEEKNQRLQKGLKVQNI